MESFVQYRLNDYSFIPEYEQRMGKDNFRKYRDDVFIRLTEIKVGESFSIEKYVKKENLNLFIKIVCYFITMGNSNYEFTDDYKYVKRNA
ncbi:MAG: hypothetical protein LBV74_12290 [Tannerella sp.]|jgi:predicted CopG family antitoxin|nr:hypothetical protein [Tannerella sp.]